MTRSKHRKQNPANNGSGTSTGLAPQASTTQATPTLTPTPPPPPTTATTKSITTADSSDNATKETPQSHFDDEQTIISVASEQTDLVLPNLESPRLTRLMTQNGTQVFLVGTAHFSRSSLADVQQVIQYVKPSAVIVELCHERYALLNMSDEEHWKEFSKHPSVSTFSQVISKQGFVSGVFYFLFLKLSASIAQKLNIAPGGEFRVALAEAQKLPGCQVYMGDRLISITLKRAVSSLSIWETFKFVYQAISATDLELTASEIENFKDKDILTEALNEMGDEFNGLKRVILDERDLYMAHSIYDISNRYETSLGPRKVVAVVGVGHVQGIVSHWGKTDAHQIQDLNRGPKPSKKRIVVGKIIKFSIYGLFGYALYRLDSVSINIVPKIINQTKYLLNKQS